MGILDELKKLTHPYDDEDEEYEDFEEPRERSFDDRRNKAEDRRNKVVNIHATTQLKVVLVKPDRFENASEIADQLKDKRTPFYGKRLGYGFIKGCRTPGGSVDDDSLPGDA